MPSFDYAAMSDRKDQIVQKLRNGIKQLLKANGVTVFQGNASFQPGIKILVAPAANREQWIHSTTLMLPGPVVLTRARPIICTGTTSAMPGFLPSTSAW